MTREHRIAPSAMIVLLSGTLLTAACGSSPPKVNEPATSQTEAPVAVPEGPGDAGLNGAPVYTPRLVYGADEVGQEKMLSSLGLWLDEFEEQCNRHAVPMTEDLRNDLLELAAYWSEESMARLTESCMEFMEFKSGVFEERLCPIDAQWKLDVLHYELVLARSRALSRESLFWAKETVRKGGVVPQEAHARVALIKQIVDMDDEWRRSNNLCGEDGSRIANIHDSISKNCRFIEDGGTCVSLRRGVSESLAEFIEEHARKAGERVEESFPGCVVKNPIGHMSIGYDDKEGCIKSGTRREVR